jgi:hypothetical protein
MKFSYQPRMSCIPARVFLSNACLAVVDRVGPRRDAGRKRDPDDLRNKRDARSESSREGCARPPQRRAAPHASDAAARVAPGAPWRHGRPSRVLGEGGRHGDRAGSGEGPEGPIPSPVSAASRGACWLQRDSPAPRLRSCPSRWGWRSSGASRPRGTAAPRHPARHSPPLPPALC